MTWRDEARPIIAKVLAENAGLPEKELRKKLRAAYPFYERLSWPYKVWCDEVNVQLGKKRPRIQKHTKPADRLPACAGQSSFIQE
jgi:hypothetical protein